MSEIVNHNNRIDGEEQGEDDKSDKVQKFFSQFDILQKLTNNNNIKELIEINELNKFSKWNIIYIDYLMKKNFENYQIISKQLNEDSEIYHLNRIFYYFQIGNYTKVFDIYLSIFNKFQKNSNSKNLRYYFIFNSNALLCLIEIGLLLDNNEFSKKILQNLDSFINDKSNILDEIENNPFDTIIINYLNKMEIYNQSINFPEIIQLFRCFLNLNEGYIKNAKKNSKEYKSMYNNFSNRNRNKANYPLFLRLKKIYKMLKIRYHYLNKLQIKCFKHLNSLITKFPEDDFVKLYYYNTYGIINLKNKNINLAKYYFIQCNNYLKEGDYGLRFRFGFMVKYNIALCYFYEKKFSNCLTILLELTKIDIYKYYPFIYFRIGLCSIEILLNNYYHQNSKVISLITQNEDENVFQFDKSIDIEKLDNLDLSIKMFRKVINLCDNFIKKNKMNGFEQKFNEIEIVLNINENTDSKNKNNNSSQYLHYESYTQIFVLSFLNLLFCLSIAKSFNEMIRIGKLLFVHQIKNIIQNNKNYYFSFENYIIYAYINTNQIELAKNELNKVNKVSFSDLEGNFISNNKIITKEVYFKINLIMNSILINLKINNYEEVLQGIKSGLKIFNNKSIKNIPYYFLNLILYYLLETGQKDSSIELIRYRRIPEYFYK